ncbi:preprotein translocase subunit SecG [Synoicihabitans lomoniglobus]|uniref:Protein-export membrane protein SecG n=1 Tax=Synoicihabitans lomoniglobus TaxID=2909285 RepID=A0AAF0I331_9BACT|nr:preprotein translocase subunit SecG [Opitutaceae bacterium LMO-M01]WED66882.1 preprotein translocase subunit SecG [Opitutaceae bacterium LMO-M01]
MNLLIALFTLVLIVVSLAMVLLVLMQKAKNDGGMGSALGGGAAEATFGADTGNVLTGATIKAAIAFFVLSLLLYLGHIYVRNNAVAEAESALPTIEAPADASTATPDDLFAPATMDAMEANGEAVKTTVENAAAEEVPATTEPGN